MKLWWVVYEIKSHVERNHIYDNIYIYIYINIGPTNRDLFKYILTQFSRIQNWGRGGGVQEDNFVFQGSQSPRPPAIDLHMNWIINTCLNNLIKLPVQLEILHVFLFFLTKTRQIFLFKRGWWLWPFKNEKNSSL